jgi:hypothetical protein
VVTNNAHGGDTINVAVPLRMVPVVGGRGMSPRMTLGASLFEDAHFSVEKFEPAI